MVAAGNGVIVTEVVAVCCEHPPVAAMVYVTVYVFGVLLTGVIAPVPALIVNPAGAAEYVPPAVPVLVTVAVPAFWQKGLPV